MQCISQKASSTVETRVCGKFAFHMINNTSNNLSRKKIIHLQEQETAKSYFFLTRYVPHWFIYWQPYISFKNTLHRLTESNNCYLAGPQKMVGNQKSNWDQRDEDTNNYCTSLCWQPCYGETLCTGTTKTFAHWLIEH